MYPIKLCSGWLAPTIHRKHKSNRDRRCDKSDLQKGQPQQFHHLKVWGPPYFLLSDGAQWFDETLSETYWSLYSRSVWLNIHCYTCRCLLSTATDCSHVSFNRFSQGHIVINNSLPVHLMLCWHWPFTDSTVLVPEQYRISFEWLLFSLLLLHLLLHFSAFIVDKHVLFNCCLLLLSPSLDVYCFLCFSYLFLWM